MNFSIHTDKNGNRYITCPKCGLQSYNINDIKYGYCARCAVFFEDLKEEENDSH